MSKSGKMIQRSAMGLVLLGLLAQPCQGWVKEAKEIFTPRNVVSGLSAGMAATMVALSPAIYDSLKGVSYYSKDQTLSPEVISASVPKKLIATGVFASIVGLQALSVYVKKSRVNNVANIKKSWRLKAGNILDIVFPGLIALAGIHLDNDEENNLRDTIFNRKFRSAACSLGLVAGGLFAAKFFANVFRSSGIKQNTLRTLSSWNIVKAKLSVKNEKLDLLAKKIVDKQPLTDIELTDAQLELRKLGFDETISGLVVK